MLLIKLTHIEHDLGVSWTRAYDSFSLYVAVSSQEHSGCFCSEAKIKIIERIKAYKKAYMSKFAVS